MSRPLIIDVVNTRVMILVLDLLKMESLMNAKKANQIIAEYMGHKEKTVTGGDAGNGYWNHIQNPIIYNKSLDALVPVWKKLRYFENEEVTTTDREMYFKKWHDGDWLFDFGDSEKGAGFGKTIQEAAAIATAKAINEMV